MFERPLAVARHRGLTIGIAAIVVTLDQLAKMAVVAALGPGRERHDVDVVGSLLRFEYVENRGAAFGVLRGQSALLLVFALGVLAGLVLFYRRLMTASPGVALGVGLVAGGAVGNLIDRARSGYVVDFVAVGPWPRFNVADSAITIGVVVLAAVVIRDDGRTRATRATAGALPPPGPTLRADG